MEYRLVGQAGYPFHHIEITGFQRRLSLNNIKRNIVTPVSYTHLGKSADFARQMLSAAGLNCVVEGNANGTVQAQRDVYKRQGNPPAAAQSTAALRPHTAASG